MSTPYRDAAIMLLCPHCADLLDDLQGGVYLCVQCEGLWISKPALKRLVDLKWPVGSGAWWRNELDCPECAATATKTTMNARMSGVIVIDECGKHGAWFDRTELSRLLRSNEEDLIALRARISVAAPTAAELEERRARHTRERELRVQASTAYRAAIAETEEQRRMIAAEKREAELRVVAERKAAEQRVAAAVAAHERENRERLDKLRTARDDAEDQLRRREDELAHFRERLVVAEKLVADQVTRVDKARDAVILATKNLDAG